MNQVYIYRLAIILFTNWVLHHCRPILQKGGLTWRRNIVKGKTDPRVDCSHKCICFNVISQSYPKSASESRPNFSIKISTKRHPQSTDQNQPQNFDQISALKSWPKIYLKILAKLQLYARWKIRFKISTKLQLQNLNQPIVDTFLSNTNNVKKFWVGIFKGQSHISQVPIQDLEVSLGLKIVYTHYILYYIYTT